MSAVTKSEGWDVYHVRSDGEWATVVVKGWQGQGLDGSLREVGEILVHSSYGSWGYQWGHLGEPFKQWLADLPAYERSYVAGKFLGSAAYEFDGDATVALLCERLLEWRRSGDLSRDEARTIWDWIEDNAEEIVCSEADFFKAMESAACGHAYGLDELSNAALKFFDDAWDMPQRCLHRGFAGFWRCLWPPFQQALRTELEALA